MDQTIRRVVSEGLAAPTASLDLRHLPNLRVYFEGFLDQERLKTDLASYAIWASTNSAPVLQGGFLHRPLGTNMLVAAIWSCKNWETIRREHPNSPPPAGAKRLARIALDLATLESHSPSSFDEPAREFLQQRLQSPEEVWGVIHEVQTSTFFIRKGAGVDPAFLRKSNREDLIVNWEGHEVPVQCKSKRPGAGRVVIDETFNTLGGYIARDTSDDGRKILVRIGSTGPIQPADVDALRNAVRSIPIRPTGAEILSRGNRTYTIQVRMIEGIFTQEEASVFLESQDFHVQLLIGIPSSDDASYEPIVAVGIDSDPSEMPWRSLSDSINEAADQLEGGQPGIIAVHYADHLNDFESIRPGSQPLKFYIFEKTRDLPHVAAVVLSSEPDLQLPGSGEPGQAQVYGFWTRLPSGLLDDLPLSQGP